MYDPSYPSETYDRGYRNGYSDGYHEGISEADKAQVRSQVEEEIQENDADGQAPSSVVDKLNDPNYIFVVSESTNVPQAASSETCTLEGGDLLKIVRAPSEGDDIIRMKVWRSRSGNCAPGSEVFVSMDTLQKFQNGFSRSIEGGLEKLESEQDQPDQSR
jgi:hypothetical protein